MPQDLAHIPPSEHHRLRSRLRRWWLLNIAHRWGIGFRDDYVCVYCGRVAQGSELFGAWEDRIFARESGRVNVAFNATISPTGMVSYPQVPWVGR